MFDLGIPVSERIVSILQPGDVWLWMVVEISPIMCVYIYMRYMTNNWVYMGCVCVCVNYWFSIDWFLRENLQETMFSYLQILRFPAGFPLNVPDI